MTKNITKTIAIVLSSLFLLGLTVFLAYKIYQTRQENLAPTKPEAVSESCTLEFSIKPEPAEPECYQTCDPDNDLCPNGLVCQEVGGNPVCVNPDCPEEEDCVCPEPIPECYQTCDLDNDLCAGDLVCQEIEGNPVCVNSDCPEEEECVCPEEPTATPTPSPKITATPTPTPTPISTVTSTPSPTETPLAKVIPTASPTEPTQESKTIVQATPTTPPPTALPEAGSILPTLGVILGGIALAALGFFFAF